ncbi:ABC-2 type transport system permease protein [Kribbella voronezhensis]|uniref:ABC-2 type transport system permease protein n=1 Tax=Kribbella voronezhensis TaxID=2512212 RepID=A0A4R7T786_9ACTN|nr:ABC transporter permease subunit [Kribbella voronezhensis]TDU87780.1 ABC-2 type transport system permease protein [Kribbella voronezhensis]
MNLTIARLTMSTLFGHRRGLLLFILPAVMLALCVLLALTVDDTAEFSTALLQMFGLAVIVPLVSLLAATGALASEIDDGSIVYLLSKPIRRSTIIVTKALVAVAVIVVLGAVPMVIAGLILDFGDPRTALAFGAGTLVAGIAYTAIFTALSVMSGNAVTIGLIYALLWEGVMGQYVGGAKALSVQQWSLAVVQHLTDAPHVKSDVKLPIALILLVAVTLIGITLAIGRLRSLVLSTAE